MTEQTTPEAPTASTTMTTVPDLVEAQRLAEENRAARQAEAEATVLAGPEEALKAEAKRAREDYLTSTATTREAPGYVERYAAYDSTRLAFIEGTIGTSAKAARDAAKGLGHEGSHIETRPV